MKKVANVLLTIFSWGVLFAVVAGGISIIGYGIAIIIGGEIATELCHWIRKEYFPLLIQATSIFVGLGLVGMYLEKKKALVIETEDIHNAVKKDK